MLAMLERFPGYTYSSLMAEDARFLRLVKVNNYGIEAGGDGVE